ncbi:IMP cyclohydrolase [Candidatus Bathyarchaeota archaeon]|nr:IMP cyclohydrolase [Candidatus Bathyarchaeota archaeon]MBS7631019.1 IMP cyclohydrolase [Candidatus Bathyarchaeota archaeon]
MSEGMRNKYRTSLEEHFPSELKIIFGGEEVVYEKTMSLRYGENPHQPASFYKRKTGIQIIGGLEELKTGKGGLSQTNIEDVNNALNILKYFRMPACAIMKHLNPSGVAIATAPNEELKKVYVKARDCDSLAAFGGIVVFNTLVDGETANEITSTFVEVVAAPLFSQEALEIFARKKDLRILRFRNLESSSRFVDDTPESFTLSTLIDGSIIVSTPLLTRIRSPEDFRIVTRRKFTTQEASDLLFSWYVCMNVRSNGIVVSKKGATLGIGSGQQDRVTAVKLALEKAVDRGHSEDLKGAVLASDGFFPFPDSIELMEEYGIKACIQPGGSVKDREVIEACEKLDIAMAFTDERCFRHF